jgi:LysM repeat protein
LIELYDLDQYNTATKQSLIVQATPADRQKSKSNAVAATQKAEKFFQSHKVYKNPNRTKYIVAGEHDTFYQISKEFAVSLRQLNKWNDFPPMKDVLAKGDKIYIMRKRKSTKSDQVRLEINQNKPLWEIAQDHGIQLKALASLNHITSPDIALQKGDVVYLK